MKYIIYGIVCPFTDEVRYIGKSTSGLNRPLQHLSKSHSKRVNEWVAELKELGFEPAIKVIEECSKELLNDKEKFWIYKYIKEQKLLLNISYVNAAMLLCDISRKITKDKKHSIGEYVRTNRKMLKMTQPEMAKKANVGLRFLRELEQGKKMSIRLDKVLDVVSFFGGKIYVE